VKKAILIGLIICVLAVGGIGAAFATGVGFPTIGTLAMGTGWLPNPFEVDEVGFHLDSAQYEQVRVDGVYLSFNQRITDAAFSVSLRGENNEELCYCALNNHSQLASETRCFHLQSAGTLPTPAQVYGVKVTVGENSVYNAAPAGGWVFGPGDSA